MKIKDNINLEELCDGGRWQENEKKYFMEDEIFGEYLEIDKSTRKIVNYGFNGVLNDLYKNGYIE